MFIKGTSNIGYHPKLRTYHESLILPVLNTEELLFSSRHKGLLRQFRDLSDLSAEHYDQIYTQLIYRFLEFAQLLPYKPNGILGSLINRGLARAAATLQKYCQIRQKAATPLLRFAVFSAALLKDLGRVISNQRIVLVDASGDFIQDWNPFAGSMLKQRAEYFKMYPIGKRYVRIESEATLLFAEQVMPREAFLWLSSDLSVFSSWLAALLNHTDADAKEITWALALMKPEDIFMVLNSLDGANIEGLPSTATEYGEAFYQWLKEAIESGKIEVNNSDALVHVTEAGVFLEEKLFKEFAELSQCPVNFNVVFAQFGNLMGIAAKGGNDFLHAQYFSGQENVNTGAGTFTRSLAQQTGSQVRHGLLVSDPALLFLTRQVPATTPLLKAMQSITPEQHKQPISTSNVTIQKRFDSK